MVKNRVDIISDITNILRAKGHPDPGSWVQHPFVQCCINTSPELERINVNRYWRQYLGGLNVDTTMERYCLSDYVDHKSYIKDFNNIVSIKIMESL